MDTPVRILIILLTVFTASAIQAASGFGFGIFVMMIFPYFFPTATAAAVSTLLSILSCSYITVKLRRHIRFRHIVLPLISYFFISYLCITFSAASSPMILKRLLAAALIILSVYFIFFNGRIKLRPTPAAGLAAGAVSGLLGGLFSISGPPMVLYLLSISQDRDAYLANIQAFFLITNLYTTLVRTTQGLIHTETLGWWALLAPAMLGGLALGQMLFRRLDAAKLQRLIYAVMAVSGIIFLF